MTNYEYIKSLSKEELAKFLGLGVEYDSIWDMWFGEKYCNNCAYIDIGGHPHTYCELHDDMCKFLNEKIPDSVKTALMWLDEERKED